MVVEDYEEPQLSLDYTGGGDSYTGLDRFNRIVDQVWTDYGASQTADEYQYGYDRLGDVLWKENVVAGDESPAVNLDELYTYDKLGQLTSVTRGDLNSAHDAVLTGTEDFAQLWALDGFGNWSNFKNDQNGDGTWDLNQNRTADGANEIATISGGWATPAYDRAGNTTTLPKPANPGTGLTGKYDAWNRLVEVRQGSNVLADYQYDGESRLIFRSADTNADGTLDTFTHYYYAGVQVVETRDAASHPPSPRLSPLTTNTFGRPATSILPILRDTYVDGEISAAGRIYYLTDANNNVTALADSSGNIIERYVYDAYGKVTIYDATWSNTRSSSAYGNSVLFGGMALDAVTGLYGDLMRWYHPGLGTFTSRDPLGLSAGANVYRYAGDNPVDRADPSGLDFIYTTQYNAHDPSNYPPPIEIQGGGSSTDAMVEHTLPDGRKILLPLNGHILYFTNRTVVDYGNKTYLVVQERSEPTYWSTFFSLWGRNVTHPWQME